MKWVVKWHFPLISRRGFLMKASCFKENTIYFSRYKTLLHKLGEKVRGCLFERNDSTKAGVGNSQRMMKVNSLSRYSTRIFTINRLPMRKWTSPELCKWTLLHVALTADFQMFDEIHLTQGKTNGIGFHSSIVSVARSTSCNYKTCYWRHTFYNWL
jgi:hypothetical protein